jgi:hypothetical protein
MHRKSRLIASVTMLAAALVFCAACSRQSTSRFGSQSVLSRPALGLCPPHCPAAFGSFTTFCRGGKAEAVEMNIQGLQPLTHYRLELGDGDAPASSRPLRSDPHVKSVQILLGTGGPNDVVPVRPNVGALGELVARFDLSGPVQPPFVRPALLLKDSSDQNPLIIAAPAETVYDLLAPTYSHSKPCALAQ